MLISAAIAIRSRRRSAIGVLAILIAIALSVLVNAPAPARPLPVPYGNAEMLRVAVHDWNGSVDGANDYSCKPTRKHPNPVVLIGSTFLSDAVNWTALGPYLHNQGYCVYTLNYGRSRYYVPPGLNGLDPMPESAQTVAATVAKVMTATRSNKVDLVGHSQGGIVARYYINALGGNRVVDKMVLLSSPYVATGLPIDVLGVAKRVIPKHLYDAVLYNGKLPPLGFNFIDPWAFSVSEPHATGIQYTQITDIADEVGIAGGMQPPRGATNATTEYINTYCPTDFSQHFAQPYSPTGTALVANALDPRHPRIPPCTVVPLYSLGG